MQKIFTIFCIVIFLNSPAMAQVKNPVAPARFDSPLAILQGTLSKNRDLTPRQLARVFVRGPNRWATFNLQSLAQIYQNSPIPEAKDLFKKGIRFEAKSLEDAIGAFQKWRDSKKFLQENSAGLDKIQNAQEQMDRAMDLLVYVLSGVKSDDLNSHILSHEFEILLNRYESGKRKSPFAAKYWMVNRGHIILQMRDEISNFPFMRYEKDKSFYIKQLTTKMAKLSNTPFSFDVLEDTPTAKGLHEFRREVRWITFHIKNANGTITYLTDAQAGVDTCPVPSLAPLVNIKKLSNSVYTRLPKSSFPEIESPTCKISRCLFYDLSSVVSTVGKIKDEVELINELEDLNNRTPEVYANEVREIERNLKDTKTLDHLNDQLQSCI